MSEIVSSNTLFHFTQSIDNLKGILSEGFRISYVPEKIPERDSKNKGYYIAPMVCLCDIPLQRVKTHLDNYGDYGIGVLKNFCKYAEINPVFYIYSSCAFDHIFPGYICRIKTIDFVYS